MANLAQRAQASLSSAAHPRLAPPAAQPNFRSLVPRAVDCNGSGHKGVQAVLTSSSGRCTPAPHAVSLSGQSSSWLSSSSTASTLSQMGVRSYASTTAVPSRAARPSVPTTELEDVRPAKPYAEEQPLSELLLQIEEWVQPHEEPHFMQLTAGSKLVVRPCDVKQAANFKGIYIFVIPTIDYIAETVEAFLLDTCNFAANAQQNGSIRFDFMACFDGDKGELPLTRLLKGSSATSLSKGAEVLPDLLLPSQTKVGGSSAALNRSYSQATSRPSRSMAHVAAAAVDKSAAQVTGISKTTAPFQGGLTSLAKFGEGAGNMAVAANEPWQVATWDERRKAEGAAGRLGGARATRSARDTLQGE
uniref:Uncharacterized protein n=1 Tax=Tetradesmus obliquus TaxID=3088 RepID=A0A383WLS0_TETOB|eukprot:jgi/Sobl393_1/11908/SZX78074.1